MYYIFYHNFKNAKMDQQNKGMNSTLTNLRNFTSLKHTDYKYHLVVTVKIPNSII